MRQRKSLRMRTGVLSLPQLKPYLLLKRLHLRPARSGIRNRMDSVEEPCDTS